MWNKIPADIPTEPQGFKIKLKKYLWVTTVQLTQCHRNLSLFIAHIS